MLAKMPFSTFRTSSTEPCSAIEPSSKTMMRSKFIMVSTRWAMAMTVVMGKPLISVFWAASWVTGSSAEVHSSRRSTGGCLTTMRARLSNCLCPKLKLAPSREISESMPSGRLRRNGMSCTHWRASQIRPSGNSPNGSILKRQLPSNTVGSCGTSPTMDRSVARPSLEVSLPPTRIRPDRGSSRRSMQSSVVDLPQPVFPTKPHFMRGSMVRLMPWSTLFSFPYPADRSSSWTRIPSENLLFHRSNQRLEGGLHNSCAINSAEFETLFTAMIR
mmetsp:Transcript_7871/g.12546  ORF Transcript_7871/g.12546 Transcript_7871/m.12546 type:complete len:273 (+) Transcript_7871:306-1124(+)